MAQIGGGRIGGGTIASLFEELYKGWYGAKGRHRERYKAGLGELRGAAEMYGPGYMAGQERTAIAGAQQEMVGRGLGGTTRPGAISAGMRAGFEDVRREKRAGAMTNIAQYMGGFREMEADPGTLTHLATGGFSGMLQEKGMGLQEEAMRAPGGALSGGTQRDPDYMSQIFGEDYQRRLLGVGGGGTRPTPTTPTYTAPGGSYGEMTSAANIQMAPGAGGTYYGAGADEAEAMPADFRKRGEPMIMAAKRWSKELQRRKAAPTQFGPPTSYYGPSGGWQDWEKTGGQITR